MKWMIASDIHGSAFWCRKLVEAFRREEADRLILLGDVLYHGPRNDTVTSRSSLSMAATSMGAYPTGKALSGP